MITPNLHPYQIEGVQYALKHRNTLIADEMGLGKTVQAIAYINENPEIKSVLIVCPLSLKLNWRRELSTWLLAGERCSVNVIHYDELEKGGIGAFDLVIADEAQYLKNAKTTRHKLFREVARMAKHLIMLTGTPFENKVLELWPLLQLLKPETWDGAGEIWVNKKKVKVGAGEGAGFFRFAKRYCDGKKVVLGRGPKAKSFWDFSGASNTEELNMWLRKTGMIRRLKKDVLTDLPPKQRQLILLENPGLIDDYYEACNINEKNFENIIESLHKDKVAFTEWSKRRAEQGKAKCAAVIEHVTRCIENGTDKIIVFAYHKEVIATLAQNLVFAGCTYITAEMGAEERQNAVDVFNDDPNCKVIIGGYDTMGTGYSMNGCDLVVCAEIHPVPGKMYQAEDRAHRFGKKNTLWVHYLVFDGTLEANICKILVKKAGIINQVLGG